ncbi:MAG: nicotinamide riboside transporter PnuC [Acidobacteria bacterium]|nr:nicotinamide riboside transporter PnuC [Acidobacteriota bacterium]
MSPIEILGVVTGILSVWLTTRQKIWCWPIGIASVATFIVVFFRAKLYASMGLQCVYVALLAYGWYAWLHGGAGHGELRVSRAARRVVLALGALATAATIGLGLWLDHRTNQAWPYADAFVTSFSLAAQWMQTRKFLENWVVWIVVDVAYVAMVVSQGLSLTAGLYLVYVALALVGFRDWRRSMRAQAAA